MIEHEQYIANLRSKFNSYSPVSDRSWSLITEIIRFQTVEKGEILLAEGQISRKVLEFALNRAVNLGASHATLQASVMGKGLYDNLGFREDFSIKNYVLNQNFR